MRRLAFALVPAALALAGCPEMRTVDPNPCGPGEALTISGAGFGDEQGTSAVLYDGVPIAIQSWSDGEILASVPEGKTPGVYPVRLVRFKKIWGRKLSHRICAEGADACAPPLGNLVVRANPNNALSAFVTFETDEPATPSVTVHAPEGDWEVPAGGILSDAPGTSHRVGILGLKENRTYPLTVRATDAVGNVLEATASYSTPNLPGPILPIVVHASDPERMPPGYMVFSVISPLAHAGGAYIFILDAAGDPVWYHKGRLIQEVRRTSAGNLLYMTASGGLAYNVEIDMWGETVREVTNADVGVDTFHHDAIELPGGNELSIGTELRAIDGYPGGATYDVVGDTLVEYTPAGEFVSELRFLDLLDPYRVGEGFHLPFWDDIYNQPTKDWSHANGVAYDPTDDTFVVSARHLDVVFKMRRTGELVWVLGADDPATAGDDGWPWLTLTSGRLPSQMHDPRILEDGTLLLYDNGNAVGFSRAVAYAIDAEALTAAQTWEWIDPDYDPPLFASFVGGVDKLPNGNVLIAHGGLGGLIFDLFHPTWIHLSQVDPVAGEKVFEATIQGPVGYMGYRARYIPSLYPTVP